MTSIGFKNFQVYVCNLVANAHEYGKFEDFSYNLDKDDLERVLYIWTSNAKNNPYYIIKIEYDNDREYPWIYRIYTGWNFDKLSDYGYGLSLKEAVDMANTASRPEKCRDGFYL